MALEADSAVQDVDYAHLKERLLADGQVLEAATASLGRGGIAPKQLDGTVVDDLQAKLVGNWSFSASSGKWVGGHYLHDGNAADGKAVALFECRLPQPGHYEVRLSYSQHANRATNVPVEVRHAEGHSERTVNQRKQPPLDGRFVSLGSFEFSADKPAAVSVSNRGTDGYVTVDAVQWVRQR